MRLLSILQRVFRRREKPAVTSEGIAFGYGIERLDIVPGVARRVAMLQARIAVEAMTDAEREAHMQVFGTPEQKAHTAKLREQLADTRKTPAAPAEDKLS